MSDLVQNILQQTDPNFDPFAQADPLGGRPTPIIPTEPGTPASITPAAPVKNTYTLGDTTFEYESPEDLAAQITEFHNRRIEAELLTPSGEEPIIGLSDTPTALPEPTTDQLAATMLLFQSNPIEAIKRLNEYAYGMPFNEIQQQQVAAKEVRDYIYGDWVGQDFKARHVRMDEEGYQIGGDYYPCPENASKLRKFLEVKGLEPSPQNYDYALAQLNAINALVPIPEVEYEEDNTQQASTGLSDRDSYYPDERRQGKLSAKDIERLARQVPMGELRNAIREGRLVNAE
jgi:hypothetical protein